MRLTTKPCNQRPSRLPLRFGAIIGIGGVHTFQHQAGATAGWDVFVDTIGGGPAAPPRSWWRGFADVELPPHVVEAPWDFETRLVENLVKTQKVLRQAIGGRNMHGYTDPGQADPVPWIGIVALLAHGPGGTSYRSWDGERPGQDRCICIFIFEAFLSQARG